MQHTIQQILLTKPLTTANPLLQSLKTFGIRVLSFPTLEIAPLPEAKTYFQRFGASFFNMALFISPTAVQYAVQVCDLNPLDWAQTPCIAQGPGTAKALKNHGFPNILFPEKEYTSESVLALPILKEVHRLNIAIFKGLNGRGFLSTQLSQRGATLIEFNCYERCCPQTSWDLSESSIPPENTLFIVTSAAALENLALLLDFAHSPPLKWSKCHLLVIHDKMRQLARNLGHQGGIDCADNASDEAIITCLQALLAS